MFFTVSVLFSFALSLKYILKHILTYLQVYVNTHNMCFDFNNFLSLEPLYSTLLCFPLNPISEVILKGTVVSLSWLKPFYYNQGTLVILRHHSLGVTPKLTPVSGTLN